MRKPVSLVILASSPLTFTLKEVVPRSLTYMCDKFAYFCHSQANIFHCNEISNLHTSHIFSRNCKHMATQILITYMFTHYAVKLILEVHLGTLYPSWFSLDMTNIVRASLHCLIRYERGNPPGVMLSS